MDLLYVVRPGEGNDELRWSLRSVAQNVKHDRVWIAGFMPSWVTGVGHIPVEQPGLKWANSTANMRAACEHPEVSDRFLVMNDDFMVLEPLDSDHMPIYHRGPVTEVLAEHAGMEWNPYITGMRATLDRLRETGHPEPLSFELHIPMPVSKAVMLAALDLGSDIPVWHKRTAAGTLGGLQGDQIADVKIHGRWEVPAAGQRFVSTNDRTFQTGQVGRWLRDRFPERCRFESC